jgi:hypothetical protein|tara:strand:- start:916 stop:1371 length:456 start_codon:yes stop_codon:yes gene_type:complete
MMSVEHIALEKVENPKLVVALKRWCRLCGQGEFYRREELGFGPLVGTPEILNGRSLMLATGADDPMNYVFAFFGGDFNVYDDRNFVARRLRDTPDQDMMKVFITCFAEAITARVLMDIVIEISQLFDTRYFDFTAKHLWEKLVSGHDFTRS